MVNLANIQNRINTKVFIGLGSDAVVSSVTTSSSSKWGDNTITYATGVTEKAVPYNLVYPKVYEPFGTMQKGEVDVFFNHLSTVTLSSSIVYANKSYIVTQLEDFPLLNGTLAKLCRLSEVL